MVGKLALALLVAATTGLAGGGYVDTVDQDQSDSIDEARQALSEVARTHGFESTRDDIGWFLLQVAVNDTAYTETTYTATGAHDPSPVHKGWRWEGLLQDDGRVRLHGGGGGGDNSCPKDATHISDCPPGTFSRNGNFGGGRGTEPAGEWQHVLVAYGGQMKFGVTFETTADVVFVQQAEGASRLLLLAPERGAPPGTYTLETTVQVDQPFIASATGGRDFTFERFEAIGPDGTVQSQARCDVGGGPDPRGDPGEWTFRVTGQITDPDAVNYAKVGLVLGEGTRLIADAIPMPCGQASTTPVEHPPSTGSG